MQEPDTIAASNDWWEPGAGFFGTGYMRGDDSLTGYLPSCAETLQERTQREAQGIIKLLELKDQHHLIDVPCGYGRHVLALAQHGIRCVGVDINDEHLNRAQALDIQKQAQFIQADMRSFASKVESKFEAVTNMFFSFGFFPTDEENEVVLQQFYSVLKPGGRCLVHTDVSPEIIASGRYRQSEERPLNQGTLKIREQYDELSRRLVGKWCICDGDGEFSLTPYSVRIYSAKELAALFQKTSFRNVKCFGGFDGRPFDATSEELLVVGER